MVRVEGLDVTKATAQREGATEGEAVVAAAMTVAVTTAVVDMTAVVDTTVAEEEDLLVWGKLHSATAPKVPLFTVKYETWLVATEHIITHKLQAIHKDDFHYSSALCSRSSNCGSFFSFCSSKSDPPKVVTDHIGHIHHPLQCAPGTWTL